jgi:hypothetical protein
MNITDNRGRSIPFFVGNYTYESIATADFDPITTLHDARHVHPTEMNTAELGRYSGRGFLVRPNATGLFYGITWEQYVNNKKSLTGLTPQPFLAVANTWIECPYVKIYASNSGGGFNTVATYCNIAPL